MKEQSKTTETAIDSNLLLTAVLPCQVKYKGSIVQLKKIVGQVATVRFKHAGYWHDYDKDVNVSDLTLIPDHKHDIDSFNRCCQICGLYCG